MILFTLMNVISSSIYKFKTPKIILLGDSEFQGSFSGGIGTMLDAHYSPNADVVNRGLSGFNSIAGLEALNELVQMKEFYSAEKENPNGNLVIVMFGDNDCANNNWQHVDLSKYTENLFTIGNTLRSLGSNYEVLFMTPVPIHDELYKETCEKGGRPVDRYNADLNQYRNGMIKVANDNNFKIVDIWGDQWADRNLYYDGLHPNTQGYAFMMDIL